VNDHYERRERRRRLTNAAAALVTVIVAGTVGFSYLEGWDPERALFFTLITITTVGYGDEGISHEGRVLAIGLLVGGVAVASYAFAVAMENALASQLAWRKKMERRIRTIREHVIVCGFGRMGTTIAEQLRSAGRSVVVIESHEDRFMAACEQGYPAVQGSASSDEVLTRAGIPYATHLVSVVDDELENIVVTLTARELRPELPIIARAERAEEVRKLRRAGATRTVSPFHSGGSEVANAILNPKVADFLARSSAVGSDVALAEVAVEEGSPLAGLALEAYGRREDARISFVALERPGKDVLIPPRGSEVLQPGDLLIVAGHPDDVLGMRDRARAGAGAVSPG
jgi:voltage-gated potassium channel